MNIHNQKKAKRKALCDENKIILFKDIKKI